MKISGLAGIVGAVSSSENVAELSDSLAGASRCLGMAGFNLSVFKRDPREFMSSPTLTNWDALALAEYQNAGWAERDPLLNYAGSNGQPRVWTAADWLNDARCHDYHIYLHEAEVAGGITIPLREK